MMPVIPLFLLLQEQGFSDFSYKEDDCMLTPEEAGFFGSRSAERSLYDFLSEQIKNGLPPFDMRVQRTQITFVNPKVFACVSLRWKNCIVVSFGLPDRVSSPRIHQAVEIRPGRWTHHVKISSQLEVDDELMGWLHAAFLFAAGQH